MARPKKSSKIVPVVSPTEFSSVISMSLKEAAVVTGLALWCLRSAIWDGNLPARLVGKKQIVLRVDLERWVADQPIVRQRIGRAA